MATTTDIQKLITLGKIDTAIEQINLLMEAQPTTNLHLLRLQALSGQLKDVMTMRASLDWLSHHDASALNDARTQLDCVIRNHLTGLAVPGIDDDTRDTETRVNEALDLLQSLEPIADHFPIIHLSLGLILMHQSRSQHRTERSPLDILDDILADREDLDRRRRPRFFDRDRQRVDLYQQAETHLRKASVLLPNQDPHRGAALESLGQVYEGLKDYTGAWKAYREAAACGCDVESKLQALQEPIREAARAQVLQHIDRLLMTGDLEGAARLIAACTPADDDASAAPPHAAITVRAADLRFLNGDLDAAAHRYEDLLE